MHNQEGVILLPAVVQKLGQFNPLLWAYPGAVLVEGHLEMQIGKLIQLRNHIEQVVQHVTCKRQNTCLHPAEIMRRHVQFVMQWVKAYADAAL